MRGWAAIGAGVGAAAGMVVGPMVTPHIQGMTLKDSLHYGGIVGAMFGAATGAFIGAGSPPVKQIGVTGVSGLQREWGAA